jgi:hypothetical protein
VREGLLGGETSGQLLKWKGNVSLPKGYKKTDTVKYVFENENERIKEWAPFGALRMVIMGILC